MRDRNKKRVTMKTKEQVDAFLKSYGVELEHDEGYDAVYLMHMIQSDFVGSSIHDEVDIAKHVKDILDDVDGYEGIAFTRFLADCEGKGVPIIWEDMI